MRNPDDPTASTDSPTDGQTFYGRWSRRKRQARDGVLPADDPSTAASAPTDPRPGNPAAVPSGESPVDDPAAREEQVLTDVDMPPLESLGENDDYSGFMSPGVSEGLRNLALRKLFRSSQYNVVDGLDDYADDFTKFEPLGDIITSDMRHQMELQAEREKREAEEKARAMLDDDSAPGKEGDVAQEADAVEEAGVAQGPETAGPVEADEPGQDPQDVVLTETADARAKATPDADPEEPRDV